MDEAGIRILTYPARGETAGAGTQVTGTLVEADGCLYIQQGVLRVAPVFPADAAVIDRMSRTLTFRRKAYAIGQPISVGGTTIIGNGSGAVDGKGCDVTNVVIVY